MADQREGTTAGTEQTQTITGRFQNYRMRRLQRKIRVNNAVERNLSFAINELNSICSFMNLSAAVRECAEAIYRKAVKMNLLRGRSVDVVAASSVYAACRQSGNPRTLDEVSAGCGIDRRLIGRVYRYISRELRLRLLPAKPQEYVGRYCEELGLGKETRNKSVEFLENAEKKNLVTGCGPTSLAAASIYIASVLCGEHRTQREVAKVAGITEVSVRNRCRLLSRELDIE